MSKPSRSGSQNATSETGRRREPADAELLTMEEAIKLLKTTRPTFYRWVRTGRLRGTKVGRQWRFTRQDVERFMSGDGPRIDLPADIQPLIEELTTRLKAFDGEIPASERHDQDQVSHAVGQMIRLAIAMKATDIHVDARKDAAWIRVRVDGALHVIARFDVRLLPMVVERWKSLAGLNVHEKALPQDGRCLYESHGARADLRVSSMPACLGECVVARLLRPENVVLELARLPFTENDHQRIMKKLASPAGIILVTGPTGCGKTTTLYACMREIVNDQKKVVSVEDPVEYLLPGLTQVQVNVANGLTFERAMRSVLRGAPDVIMVGEIRNAETMQLCIQAALTGHQVMSVMHTDEAASALRRMIDVGCEPYAVADAVALVVAQRLVRRLCPACSQPCEPPADQLAAARKLAVAGGVDWDELPRNYRESVGCAKCNQLGFAGRTLLAETLEMTPQIASALHRRASPAEIRQIAVDQGMTTMGVHGIRRAAEGEVTLSEVLSIMAAIDY